MRQVIRRMKKRGFTLVELMIVVAIVGVLAVLAIYGVRKYIANAKTTEARNGLGQIAKDAASAFDRESGSSTVVGIGGSSAVMRALCQTSSKIPAAKTAIASQKYQSAPSEWSTDPGWVCLKFNLEQPQYYMYQYVSTNTSADKGVYSATAEGDLNADGNTSKFEISGSVQSGALTTSPVIGETNPEE